MNYVGLTALAIVVVGLLCAVFVELAATGIFLRLRVDRRFSLRDLLIATTVAAIALGLVVWLVR